MSETTSDSPPGPAPPERPKLRGLWDVMSDASEEPRQTEGPPSDAAGALPQSAASPTESAPRSESDPPSPAPADPAHRPHGLWSVMRTSVEPPAPSAAPPIAPTSSDAAPAFAAPPAPAPLRDDERAFEPEPAPPPAFPFQPASVATPAAGPVPSSIARLAAAAGIASIPLSLAALASPVWARIPALALGFFGFAAGLAAWNEVARPRSRRTGKPAALAAVLCGLGGMFLAPLVFAPLGAHYRESTGPAMTVRNAAALGRALDQYHDQNQQYPPGGSFDRDDDGADRPLHGWMARLLPSLGEQALFDSIDFAKPWRDEANRPAMRRVVPHFLAAGADPAPVAGGFAPAHYAGVGGQIVRPGQGIVHLGVFDRNSAVRREQIVDGLSQTLIVGEVAHRPPAWGDAENWRAVGRGLNRDPNGFGNAAGTGAVFLSADGAVRFLSNKTSPDVLLLLTTRDGADSPDEP